MFKKKKHYVVMFTTKDGIHPATCNVFVKAYSYDDAIVKAKKKLFTNSIYLVELFNIDVEVIG